MSNHQESFDVFDSPTTSRNTFQIREIVRKVLFHWPLFILFLGISIPIAYFYVKVTQPVYDIEAKVLIKDDVNKRSEGAPLEELNLNGTSKGVETEMGLLTSIPIVNQVVTDLKLWVTYKEQRSFFVYRDIYNRGPVQFILTKAGKSLNNENIDVFIENQHSFTIKQSDNQVKRFSFNEELSSNFGTWKLDTTSFFNSYIGKTIRINVQNPKDVVRLYQSKIGRENKDKKNPTIIVSTQDEVPERGVAVLNDLLRVYTESSVEDKRQANQNTLHFVDERLASLTGELNSVETKYVGYKSSRGITEINAESNKYLNNQSSADERVQAINIQLSILDGIEQYVNSNQGAENPPATTGLEDAGLRSLIIKLTDLQFEHAKQLNSTPENSPLLNPTKQQITIVRNAIKENLKLVRESFLKTREQIKSIGSSTEFSIKNIPGQERDLDNIKRMQGIKEDLYVYLLKKKEEISLDYASTIPDVKIVEQAHSSGQRSPLPNQSYGMALLAGLLIPAIIIFGRDILKNRVISKNEIINITGLSILSELIYEDNPDRIRVLNNKDYIGEQFRDLRTKLNYLQGKSDKGKITLLTSSISGEGKSFVSSNLAITLAASGKKTIILELDLRRPQLAEIFKLPKNKPGITDFLHGDATKDQIIKQSTYTDNLFIIGCGKIPPNPSELLESTLLINFLEELRETYDHILLDTPPVHIVTDATILAPVSDVTLYMIRQDYTPKPELEFIEELFLSKKFPRLNIVFNGVQSDKHGYGYKYNNNGYYTKSPERFNSKIKRFFSRF